MVRQMMCLVTVGLLSLATWGGNLASAQPPEGGPGPGGRGGRGQGGGMGIFAGGGLAPLLVETVQKDLQLTSEQIDKLKDLAKTVREAGREQRTKFRDLSPEERQAKWRELRSTLQGRAEELKKKIEAILTTKQLERLKEIRLQVAGPAAFANPDLRKALNLTDEQKDKIKKIQADLAKQRRDLMPAAGNLRNLKPEERRAKWTELAEKAQKPRQKAIEDILAVLTPEQKTEYQKRLGKKLELKPAEMLPAEGGPGDDLPARGAGK